MMTNRGACSTRIIGTWRVGTYNFDFAADKEHHGLEKLITKAEQRYTEVGSELAKHFIAQFSKGETSDQGAAPAEGCFREASEAASG